MGAQFADLFAKERARWLLDPDQHRSSTLILLAIAGISLLLFGLYWFRILDAAIWFASFVVRNGIRAGYRVWETLLAWASWPLFLSVQLLLLAIGAFSAGSVPYVSVACALCALGMGLAACLAYMFIDVERYEVARGYKAIYNPMKGQRLAVELARYGHHAGVPLIAAAAVGMIGGFALFNLGMFQILGRTWYLPAGADVTYSDFVASAMAYLLSIVNMLALADTHNFAKLDIVRPAPGLPATLMYGFRSFFTLVLLQQIFASVRKGRLLTETIADFWSPHEPIHERARAALPQYGAGALGPLLGSLKAAETLTREQREQLPVVLAAIGPVTIPDLIYYLDDANEHIRAVAAGTLGRLQAMAALPRMVRLSKDPSDLVRLALAAALGEFAATTAKTTAPFRRVRSHGRVWKFIHRRGVLELVADPAAFTIPALVEACGDASASIRATAATSLGRMGVAAAATALPQLTGLLADADETVRSRAAEALGLVGAGDPATVHALAGMLGDPSPSIRTAAAKALGSIGTTAASAVPSLVPLLQDRDEGVRTAAADAVGRMGTLTASSADSLSEGLASDDNVVRARTAEALGAIGEAAADTAPALVEAMGDDNDRVRAKAVEALGKIGESAADVAVPELMRALKDEDNWVSALAAEALGEMGNGADEAIPALVHSLRHANPQVRTNSAQALGKLGPTAKEAAAALEMAAGDVDGGVRLEAIRALGEIGQPTADSTRVVRAALSDPDPHARATAAEAFGKWGAADDATRAELLALLEDANDEVKAAAVKVLPKLAGATLEVVEALARRLAEDDSDVVRMQAARALGKLGGAAAPAGAALVRAAQTGEAGLRGEAMRSLAATQPPEAADAFTSGLRDAETRIRILASAGWRKAAEVPDSAAPALIEALHDPEIKVRANAAYALGRLDSLPPDAVQSLAEVAAHANSGLRWNAAFALRSQTGRVAFDALHPLLEDHDPRLRLVAASRVLADDPVDAMAIAVVAEGLVDRSPRVRVEAGKVAEANVPAAAVILEKLRALSSGEATPGIQSHADTAIALMERLSVPTVEAAESGE